MFQLLLFFLPSFLILVSLRILELEDETAF